MQMREWVNDQLRAGKMALDESTVFVGMTIGAEIDNSLVNYLQKIKGGIDAAISRSDSESEGKVRREMALDIVERYQYQSLGISAFA